MSDQMRRATAADLYRAERHWANRRTKDARMIRAAIADEIRHRGLDRNKVERVIELEDELSAITQREHEVYDHYGPAGQNELQSLDARRERVRAELETAVLAVLA